MVAAVFRIIFEREALVILFDAVMVGQGIGAEQMAVRGFDFLNRNQQAVFLVFGIQAGLIVFSILADLFRRGDPPDRREEEGVLLVGSAGGVRLDASAQLPLRRRAFSQGTEVTLTLEGMDLSSPQNPSSQ